LIPEKPMRTDRIIRQAERAWSRGTQAGLVWVEVLVIVAVLLLFSAVTVPALLSAREPVLRAQCVNNLRQLGVGWCMYRDQFNRIVPIHWPGSMPWRTYEAYRVTPGTAEIQPDPTASGPWNLAELYGAGLVPSPKVFYCPAAARFARYQSYEYYSSISNTWPSTPVGSNDDKVRTGYNYYPQLRATEMSGGYLVPKPLATTSKWSAIDPTKSIATDLVNNELSWWHVASGAWVGLNALFPDGQVVFQDVHRNPEAFAMSLWDPDGDPNTVTDSPVNNASQFRPIMSLWRP
jgi:hypothetical protein